MAKMWFQRRKGVVYDRKLLGFDKVAFTRHALDMMKKRGITREIVYRVIEDPKETGLPTAPGREHDRKVIGRHVIDVVYELKQDLVRVITAYKNSAEAPKATRRRDRRRKGKKRR